MEFKWNNTAVSPILEPAETESKFPDMKDCSEIQRRLQSKYSAKQNFSYD